MAARVFQAVPQDRVGFNATLEELIFPNPSLNPGLALYVPFVLYVA
jgi:hypothetical protein